VIRLAMPTIICLGITIPEEEYLIIRDLARRPSRTMMSPFLVRSFPQLVEYSRASCLANSATVVVVQIPFWIQVQPHF